ncbi:MAG: DUF433 domain-containing protein [Chloroflexi bacterium]|nr:DUF433 domain-containing protein [Chloroflexota bacterium]
MAVQVPTLADLRKYVDTRFFDERPHIRGRRIPIATVAYNVRTNGWTIGETAHNFSLSEPEVLAALLYYHEHQDEIDRQEEEEKRLFDDMKRQHGGA